MRTSLSYKSAPSVLKFSGHPKKNAISSKFDNKYIERIFSVDFTTVEKIYIRAFTRACMLSAENFHFKYTYHIRLKAKTTLSTRFYTQILQQNTSLINNDLDIKT